MNVIVTGATSFIGRHLCLELVKQNHRVYAIVRNKKRLSFDSYYSSNLVYVDLDLENYKKVGQYLSKERIDAVFHLAWAGVRSTQRDDVILQENNLKYSLQFLEEVAGLGCKIFFTAGSQAEYGNHEVVIYENTECKPISEYGKNKVEFYLKAKELCDKKNIRIVEPRFFSLYGEDDTEATMYVSIMKKMLKNEDCELTECSQLWDFLYVDDAVKALILLLENEDAKGVFNFASGNNRPLKEFVLEMYRITNSKSVLRWGMIPYASVGKLSLQPNIDKLKKVTGWAPSISFEEGVRRTMEYLKARGL